MKRKGTYSTVRVQSVDVLALIQHLLVGCVIAIDVAKQKFVAAFANATGQAVQLVRFNHPTETRVFVGLLQALQQSGKEPRIVMEPTGSYGDAVRYQCAKLGLPVYMSQPIHTHRLGQVIDGVPSMHDPKAAVTLAQLHAIRPGKLWEQSSTQIRDLRARVDEMCWFSVALEQSYGHLEAMLARHWPEFEAVVNLRSQRSWRKLLTKHPGPEAVADHAEQSSKTLARASRGQLSKEAIEAVVEAARTTLGVPMTEGEQGKLRGIVQRIQVLDTQLRRHELQLRKTCKDNEEMSRLQAVVGTSCAAAILAYVGSPSAFASAHAFEKALGLNLKERSSGFHQGVLKITKCGPTRPRQLLYMAALRKIVDEPYTRAWYEARGAWKSNQKSKAVIAVMRKLARALWHVARGSQFDPQKLYDTRKLQVDQQQPTKPRGFVRQRQRSRELLSADCSTNKEAKISSHSQVMAM